MLSRLVLPPQAPVTPYSASNAHAVRSTVLVGCANPCPANIAGSSGLIDTGVNNACTGCAHADARCDAHARSTDTGGCYRARNTSLWNTHGLAINNGARWHGSETKAHGQH